MNNSQNKYGRFLPIGTVVLLKGAKKRLMITGFCSLGDKDKKRAYDYSGCLFPEGIITSNQIALFDHSQIEKIFHIGYSDEEEKQFKASLISGLKELVSNKKITNNVNNTNNINKIEDNK